MTFDRIAALERRIDDLEADADAAASRAAADRALLFILTMRHIQQSGPGTGERLRQLDALFADVERLAGFEADDPITARRLIEVRTWAENLQAVIAADRRAG